MTGPLSHSLARGEGIPHEEILREFGLGKRGNRQRLHCVDRYLANPTGDEKELKPPLAGFGLRCGVRNLREAYR